jgi:hypothetical protein
MDENDNYYRISPHGAIVRTLAMEMPKEEIGVSTRRRKH